MRVNTMTRDTRLSGTQEIDDLFDDIDDDSDGTTSYIIDDDPITARDLSDHGSQMPAAASASDQLSGHRSRGLSVDD